MTSMSKMKGIRGSYINQTTFYSEGMKNVLVGRTGDNGYGHFIPKRVVVIQMN